MLSRSLRPIHVTVANLFGRGHKKKVAAKDCWRMVEKGPQKPAKPIQADLQGQGTPASSDTIRRKLNNRGFYERRPRKTNT